MKVLFLDIDGVMNNRELLIEYGHDIIGHDMLVRLKRIIEATKAEIVLSSTWRVLPNSLKIVKNKLADHGLKLNSCTVEIIGGERSTEIQVWLMKNQDKISRFAILDDDSDAGTNGLNHSFFQTTFNVGLDDKMTDVVAKHLNTDAPLDIGSLTVNIDIESIVYNEDGLNETTILWEGELVLLPFKKHE